MKFLWKWLRHVFKIQKKKNIFVAAYYGTFQGREGEGWKNT